MTIPATGGSVQPRRLGRSLAGIGTVMAIAGAVATIPMKLGPAWYPIVLAIISVPCVWLGGMLYQRRHGGLSR